MANWSDKEQKLNRALRQGGRAKHEVEALRENVEREIAHLPGVKRGTRAERPSVGRSGEFFFETDTHWLYSGTDTGWQYAAGLFVGTDSERTALSITSADEGALAFSSSGGLYKLYEVNSSGAWEQLRLAASSPNLEGAAALAIAQEARATAHDALNSSGSSGSSTSSLAGDAALAIAQEARAVAYDALNTLSAGTTDVLQVEVFS